MPNILVNGINYYFKDKGGGFPLVLLHGFTGSSASWGEFSSKINGYYRTIAIDLPGHGQTAASKSSKRLSMEAVAKDIITLLARIEIPQANLLGYSMGGRLGLYLAINKPDFFNLLVLESASPGLETSKLRQARIKQDESLAVFIESEGIPAFVYHWQELPLFSSQKNMPLKKQEWQRRQRLANSPQGLAASLRGMGTGYQPSLWPKLSNLCSPTLLLSGELDPKYVAINKKMAQKISVSELKIIPGIGHNIHLEAPDEFAKTVLSFLRSGNELTYTKE